MLILHLEGSAAILPDSLLFIRDLRSLTIGAQHRTSLIGLMDFRSLPHSLRNLRACSLLLFGVYASLKRKDDRTWVTGNGNLGYPGVIEGGDPEETLLMENGEKNRPGLEEQALKKTNAMVNLRNEVTVAEKK